MKPNRIVLHHSVLDTWADCVRLHVAKKKAPTRFIINHKSKIIEGKGFSWIGYHYGLSLKIGPNGTSFVMLHSGRHILHQGAGVAGKNTDTIHIILIGNYSIRKPHPHLFSSGARLCAILAEVFRIPIDQIFGHREMAATECPGMLLNLDLFRSLIHSSFMTPVANVIRAQPERPVLTTAIK